MNRKKSIGLYHRAWEVIPGGVNSPVRAFKAVGVPPTFIERAKGSKIFDVDGNEYIDYVGSWGPMILGHAHPKVVAALKKAISKGTSFGAPTPLEVELAFKVKKAFPSMELVRMVSSGTEAVMSAIRLARGYTGKVKIIKFEGSADRRSRNRCEARCTAARAARRCPPCVAVSRARRCRAPAAARATADRPCRARIGRRGRC